MMDVDEGDTDKIGPKLVYDRCDDSRWDRCTIDWNHSRSASPSTTRKLNTDIIRTYIYIYILLKEQILNWTVRLDIVLSLGISNGVDEIWFSTGSMLSLRNVVMLTVHWITDDQHSWLLMITTWRDKEKYDTIFNRRNYATWPGLIGGCAIFGGSIVDWWGDFMMIVVLVSAFWLISGLFLTSTVVFLPWFASGCCFLLEGRQRRGRVILIANHRTKEKTAKAMHNMNRTMGTIPYDSMNAGTFFDRITIVAISRRQTANRMSTSSVMSDEILKQSSSPSAGAVAVVGCRRSADTW